MSKWQKDKETLFSAVFHHKLYQRVPWLHRWTGSLFKVIPNKLGVRSGKKDENISIKQRDEAPTMKSNGLYPSVYYGVSENLTYIFDSRFISACLDFRNGLVARQGGCYKDCMLCVI